MPFEKESDGNVLKYVGFRRDITEQKQYQEILKEEKTRAEQADKLKSAFLANMSHEIRTPLNAIVGFSELLQVTDDQEEKDEYMKIINDNNDLLLRLINDILDMSKLESGAVELKFEEFDMVDVYNATYLALKARCKNPDIEFIGENNYNKFVITSDKNRIIQIWTNFLGNSIKYTAQGYIRMGYTYEDGGLKLFVEDSGIGIAANKQEKVFGRFEKLDDFAQGTGLGLAICKAITIATKGKIGFDSVEGKGSTFWAWIPCEAEIEEKKKGAKK